MRVYFCRHGIAEEAVEGMEDGERALTKEGVKKFREGAEGFAGLRPRVTHVFTSPLKRAGETAEILRAVLKKREERGTKLLETRALVPGGSLKGFLRMVRGLGEKSVVVAVGHEPDLGEWVGTLCFGGGACELKKGGMAAVELEGGRGSLVWVMTGKILRGL